MLHHILPVYLQHNVTDEIITAKLVCLQCRPAVQWKTLNTMDKNGPMWKCNLITGHSKFLDISLCPEAEVHLSDAAGQWSETHRQVYKIKALECNKSKFGLKRDCDAFAWPLTSCPCLKTLQCFLKKKKRLWNCVIKVWI